MGSQKRQRNDAEEEGGASDSSVDDTVKIQHRGQNVRSDDDDEDDAETGSSSETSAEGDEDEDEEDDAPANSSGVASHSRSPTVAAQSKPPAKKVRASELPASPSKASSAQATPTATKISHSNAQQTTNAVANSSAKKERMSVSESAPTQTSNDKLTPPSTDAGATLFCEFICGLADFTTSFAQRVASRHGVQWTPAILTDGDKDKRKGVKTKAPKDPNMPRAPQNAYMLFCESVRKSYREMHPEKSLSQSELSEMWRKTSSDQRERFEAASRERKEQYNKLLQAYMEKQQLKV